MDDCRRIGFCASGVRRWLRGHGLDMRTMIDEGYPAEQIEALHDAFGDRAVAAARARDDG